MATKTTNTERSTYNGKTTVTTSTTTDSAKTARTLRDFITKAHGYDITVPAGSIVTNVTALGPDDNYRFWVNFQKVAEQVTGFKNSILRHDLTYHGLLIPAEYCEPWPEN